MAAFIFYRLSESKLGVVTSSRKDLSVLGIPNCFTTKNWLPLGRGGDKAAIHLGSGALVKLLGGARAG